MVATPFPEASVETMATVAAILNTVRVQSAVPAGEPADAHSISEPVAATLAEFYACLAVGNQLAAVSLATDDFVRSQIVVASGSGQGGRPAASPVPDLVADSQLIIQQIDTLYDGRIGVVVEITVPSGESRTDFVLLRVQDEEYLVEGLAENIVLEATPAP